MLYSQYLRVQTRAGGIAASNRELIKAVYSILAPGARSFKHRAARHSIIRQALEYHQAANILPSSPINSALLIH